jgi:hypothetical protein
MPAADRNRHKGQQHEATGGEERPRRRGGARLADGVLQVGLQRVPGGELLRVGRGVGEDLPDIGDAPAPVLHDQAELAGQSEARRQGQRGVEQELRALPFDRVLLLRQLLGEERR